MKKEDYSIYRDKHGTINVKPLPSEKELRDFYSTKYYQDDYGGYSATYSKEELKHIHLIDKQIRFIAKKLLKRNISTLYDLGCGEGYTCKFFYEDGVDVSASDFSEYGFKVHNPETMAKINFRTGDIVNDLIFPDKVFDVIILKNVLEHVIDPVLILNRIKEMMHESSILAIRVPNDVDNPILDSFLKRKSIGIQSADYFAPPEHLRHFSFSSLRSFMTEVGMNTVTQFSDFPIELFLLDERTSYYETDFGKKAHSIRSKINGILDDLDIEKVINLAQSLSGLSLGRQIVSIHQKRNI